SNIALAFWFFFFFWFQISQSRVHFIADLLFINLVVSRRSCNLLNGNRSCHNSRSCLRILLIIQLIKLIAKQNIGALFLVLKTTLLQLLHDILLGIELCFLASFTQFLSSTFSEGRSLDHCCWLNNC